jgi:hypothetical protein
MDRFSELYQDTIDDFTKVFEKKSFPIPIKFQFIGDSKQKNLIKISKIADDISFILKKELKVSINEALLDVYDEESVNILFEQEIDKININIDTGKIKLIKTDLNTFSSLVNKYGVEKVARANKVEELYQAQKKDATADEEFIV